MFAQADGGLAGLGVLSILLWGLVIAFSIMWLFFVPLWIRRIMIAAEQTAKNTAMNTSYTAQVVRGQTNRAGSSQQRRKSVAAAPTPDQSTIDGIDDEIDNMPPR